MISSSSSNRTPGQCDAVLSVGAADPTSSATTRSAVGPLRLPLKNPESFVARFNRIYASIGLSLQVAENSGSLVSNLNLQKTAMDTDITPESLREKKCVPCEGGVPLISAESAQQYLNSLTGWTLDDEGKTISRKVNAGNFVKAMAIMQQIADLAESEQHHPDLHLTGYRTLTIEMTTHAIGGLSENDFVVAAKIDTLLA
ncbi:putative pterin-4-alpha-carbinolamine dehydratase [Rubripirellula obstinata]|uniref:4a-hydroxytetrahydrobiopterin dehydratase n=1 Tax=Rubripirellula obstinata TaxID=406547 RepID=A0A5B1CBA1_9BACT|nr:4a-hydroxytetrahydrobiopterin dehydratase [Rubripirellula obstinata]KAA1257836.1 putative pterin-4-alpha-carbinolamine dehydratase [Rubripirellula obstinata]